MINVCPSQEVQIPDNYLHGILPLSHHLDESATSCIAQISTSDGRDDTALTNLSSPNILRVIPRNLGILLSEELEPIESLQGAEFLKAFFQIERCHYEMWNVGICHNDLSLANFMYQVDGEKKVGMLSDWDLPHATDERGEGMLERIGTVPYKALDLLIDGSRSETIPHLYRHSLEAFVWILAWTVIRHADERRRETAFSRRTWLTRDQADVSRDKIIFVLSLAKFVPPPSRTQEWVLARELLVDLMITRMERQPHRMDVVPEKDTKEVARLHWEVIEESRLAGPLKELVLAFKPQF